MKSTHREYQRLTGAVSKDPQLSNLPGLSQYQTQASSLMGHFTADLLLYPLETVLHRLHLQGTRSIIDDLDTGREVVPILTRYEGVADCFSTILQEEGFRGLFKGLGALLLQYGVHFLIIKFSSKIISQVAQLFSNTATPRIPFPDSNTVTPRAPILDPKKEQSDIKETSPRHSNVSVSQHLMEDIPRMSPVNVSSVVTSQQSPDLGRSPILTRRTKVPAEFPEEDEHQEVYARGGGSSVFSPSLGLQQDHGRSGMSSDLGLGPSTPVSTNDSSPLSPPRPGLPSLLSFGNSSTRSPQRRILPDMDYDYMKPWRSQDNL